MALRNPYPDRDGNAFRLLSGSGAFLPAMLQAIREARHYVLLEQYLVTPGEVAGQVIDALCACAQRGVRVCMMIDHFGGHALIAGERKRIVDAGIELLFYNPVRLNRFLRNLPRNHCKQLLIDGRLAYTGGAGISDQYLAIKGRPAWYDLVVEMRGPVVADWQAKFLRTWGQWGGLAEIPQQSIPAAGDQCGRLSPSFRGLKKFVKKSLFYRIRHASDRIWLGTAYFLPSRSMLRALRAASRRGVEIRLLLPGPINDHPTVYHAGHRYYHFLLRHGIRIFEYHPSFMHAKFYLCDAWCSVGSCNMDRWGLRWNLEANLESGDPALCGEVEAAFQEAFAESHEITLESWLRRPLRHRFEEWLFGYLDLIIERYGTYRELRRGKRSANTIFEPRP